MTHEELRSLEATAVSARRAGAYLEAAAAYRALEASDPDEPRWPKALADVLDPLDDVAGSVAALERAAAGYARRGFVVRAIAVYKMILRRVPEHTSALDHLVALQGRRVTGLDRLRRRGAPARQDTLGAMLHAEVAASGVAEVELDLLREPPDAVAELDALASAPIFARLSEASLRGVIDAARLVDLADRDVLYRQGDVPDAVYVVVDGTIELRVDAAPARAIAEVGAGGVVGIVGLCTGEPRPITATAREPTRLLALPSQALEALVREAPELLDALLDLARQRLLAALLAAHPVFAPLRASSHEVVRRFRLFAVARGAELVAAGQVPGHLYVVMTGRVELVDGDGDLVAAFGPGNLVGDSAFLAREPAPMAFVGARTSFVLGLTDADFVALAQAHPSFLEGVVRVAAAPVWDPAIVS